MLYARSRSQANVGSHSATRQFKAASSGVPCSTPKNKINNVTDIMSGMLPLAERTKLKNLLNGKFNTVLLEPHRAMPRNAHTSEAVYGLAQPNRAHVSVQDMPSISNPTENCIKRVMTAVCEFERDTIAARLQAGLQAK